MTLARDASQIQSARLVLRRIRAEDVDFFTRVHADPDVMKYIGHGAASSPREVLTWVHSTLATYESFSLGQLAVLRKSDGVLIGRCGLSDVAVEERPAGNAVRRVWYQRAAAPPDMDLIFGALGCTFERSYWGHGYASEVARRFGLQKQDVVFLAGTARERYIWPD